MKKTMIAIAMLMSIASSQSWAGGQFDFGKFADKINDVKKIAEPAKKIIDAIRDFSEEEELGIGQEMASNLLGAAPLYANEPAQRYVNLVGHVLAANTERAGLEWHFAVIDDMELNAFAAPGGYVFISKGLLLSMRNEAELAGVLSHEIAHVLKRHQLVAIKNNARTALGADFVAGMVEKKSGVSSNGQLSPLFHQLALIGTKLFVSKLDQEDELEADRMGIVIAARAGYNPFGLPSVLQALQSVKPDHTGVALMFKTHPPFDLRLEKLSQLMTQAFEQLDNQPDLADRFKATLTPPAPAPEPASASKLPAKKKTK
ncbi:MAG: M48 family metalloprotease [Pseudomonadota bacterium]